MKTVKKFLKSAFSILSLTYLSLVLIGWLYSDSLIFFPQKDSYAWTADLIKIPVPDSDDKTGSHYIVARYLINPESRYTLIYSHGNATDISQLTYLQSQFYNHGFSVISYDYSGYGLSEGRVSEQQVYDDVQAVYQYLLAEHALKPEDIISYGHSLGSAVATDLAFNNRVAALILESPFVSAFRVSTVIKVLPFDKFSSIDKIASIDAPVLVLHSQDDPIVPFWHGEALYEKARQPKVKRWFEDAGHAGITHDKFFWPVLDSFVTDLSY